MHIQIAADNVCRRRAIGTCKGAHSTPKAADIRLKYREKKTVRMVSIFLQNETTPLKLSRTKIVAFSCHLPRAYHVTCAIAFSNTKSSPAQQRAGVPLNCCLGRYISYKVTTYSGCSVRNLCRQFFFHIGTYRYPILMGIYLSQLFQRN